MPNFVSIGLFRRPRAAKKTNFTILLTSAFCDVPSWQRSEKVEHRCTTINLPYPTVWKSFLYSSSFMAKSGAQALTFKSMPDKQTDKQKNSTSPIKLGTVVEDLEHALAPLKLLGSEWRKVSLLGRSKFVRNPSRSTQNPHNSVTP